MSKESEIAQAITNLESTQEHLEKRKVAADNLVRALDNNYPMRGFAKLDTSHAIFTGIEAIKKSLILGEHSKLAERIRGNLINPVTSEFDTFLNKLGDHAESFQYEDEFALTKEEIFAILTGITSSMLDGTIPQQRESKGHLFFDVFGMGTMLEIGSNRSTDPNSILQQMALQDLLSR